MRFWHWRRKVWQSMLNHVQYNIFESLFNDKLLQLRLFVYTMRTFRALLFSIVSNSLLTGCRAIYPFISNHHQHGPYDWYPFPAVGFNVLYVIQKIKIQNLSHFIWQYFSTKLCSFTNFEILLDEVVMNFSISIFSIFTIMLNQYFKQSETCMIARFM